MVPLADDERVEGCLLQTDDEEGEETRQADRDEQETSGIDTLRSDITMDRPGNRRDEELK